MSHDASSSSTVVSRPDDPERLTWARTRFLIRSDFARLAEWYGGGSLTKRVYWFMQPNFQALFFYRLYRYLYVRGWHNTARLMFLYSLYMTGAEISPTTSIGPGCLIGHALGVVLFGKIGARFSILGQSGTGGGFDERDIGGGPGYPVVGDDVFFGVKSMALGAIRIGSRVKLGPAACVTCDVPDDALVLSPPCRIVKVRMGSAHAPAAHRPSGHRPTAHRPTEEGPVPHHADDRRPTEP